MTKLFDYVSCPNYTYEVSPLHTLGQVGGGREGRTGLVCVCGYVVCWVGVFVYAHCVCVCMCERLHNSRK